MPSLYRKKADYFIDRGFYYKEYREWVDNYSYHDIRTLPYFRSMITWRRLYTDRLLSRGVPINIVKQRMMDTYVRRNWLTPDGDLDPWKMLKYFRKEAIESGDYKPPPKKKGTHHPVGISKGDVTEQRRRRKARTKEGKVEEARNQLHNLNVAINTEENQRKRSDLMEQRERLERYLREN